ncbi:MAG TPA: putative quinol monooxygenase [Vicinamibacterales bacterium]
MIHVVAVINIMPGRRDEVLTHFRALVPQVRAEQGCIEYVPVVDADTDLAVQTPYGPSTFTVIEKWESLDALRAHGSAPHMAAYAAKTQDMVAERAIYVLSEA